MKLSIHSQNPNADQAILLLHGWMHSGARWNALATQLASKYCVIAPDMPGFGLSANVVTTNGHSIEGLADSVIEIINNIRENYRLYGVVAHSMGGLVTLECIKRIGIFADHFVFCAVPVCSSPIIKIVSSISGLLYLALKMLKFIPNFVKKPLIKLSSLPTVLKYSQVDDILVNDILSAHPVAASRLVKSIANYSLDEVQFPRHPLSIVCRGEYDKVATIKSGHYLNNKLGGKYFEFKQASHTPQLEVQDTFNYEVMRFFEEPTSFVKYN